ncbi:flavin reductase [Micromonospora sp. S4605]|uniref:flavin reductase family protein n=1 Tax=Micromonospora sp. S4605 TaxID=1420897 RepID=UPI000D70159C|nr:flavin reductase family protein [Micromonospora sp. S4605]PWU51542.1 flavin reductase [Micromonospora sp. S4605]
MHVVPGLKVLYFGTPVVLVSSRNPDGTANLAPMSSAWWLGQHAMLGLGDSGQTTANLRRERECVLNLPSATMVAVVDRIALTTGRPDVPEHKVRQGYRYEPDKFALAGLTAQPSELVRAPRVAECPVQLECRVVATHRFGGASAHATAFEVQVLRAYVEEDLVIPGTSYVDPLRWDPLIMKFCEFFGGGQNVHPSRLAEGWEMPHRLSPGATPVAG